MRGHHLQVSLDRELPRRRRRLHVDAPSRAGIRSSSRSHVNVHCSIGLVHNAATQRLNAAVKCSGENAIVRKGRTRSTWLALDLAHEDEKRQEKIPGPRTILRNGQ